MIIRNNTPDGDWAYGKGKADYKRKLLAVMLNIQTRLLSWKGDCFFAIPEGVDYDNLLDVGTKDLLDSDVKRVILQSEGVLKITEYESDIVRETREFSCRVTIITIFGIGRLEV